MQRFLDITTERRQKQLEYNEANGITPRSVIRPIQRSMFMDSKRDRSKNKRGAKGLDVAEEVLEYGEDMTPEELLQDLKRQMIEAAEALEFERAAMLRDKLKELQNSDKQANLPDKAKAKKRK